RDSQFPGKGLFECNSDKEMGLAALSFILSTPELDEIPPGTQVYSALRPWIPRETINSISNQIKTRDEFGNFHELWAEAILGSKAGPLLTSIDALGVEKTPTSLFMMMSGNTRDPSRDRELELPFELGI
ncbi:MAG TPA: hypothetical protein VIY47_16400, partial [Ignavibacteriaceae bacterium]